jgi:plastocyanin
MRLLVIAGVVAASLIAPVGLSVAQEPAPPPEEETSSPGVEPAAEAPPSTAVVAGGAEPAGSEADDKKVRAAADGSVSIGDFFFSPASITVGIGDSVTWTNNGQETHNATGNGIGTGNLDTGESGSASFSSAGSFTYICTIHPQMNGTVRVLASASGSGDVESGGDPDDLPATGAELLLQAVLGAALGLGGLGLRRRAARP